RVRRPAGRRPPGAAGTARRRALAGPVRRRRPAATPGAAAGAGREPPAAAGPAEMIARWVPRAWTQRDGDGQAAGWWRRGLRSVAWRRPRSRPFQAGMNAPFRPCAARFAAARDITDAPIDHRAALGRAAERVSSAHATARR